MYYNHYCVVLQDNKNKDEIVIFRPSSMPITEVIDDEEEFDKAKPTTIVKIVKSEMEKVLLDYAVKSIAYKHDKEDAFNAFEIRKQYTIGLGPLFHVILSENPIYYSLDDKADQVLVSTVGKTTILSWRMMLEPTVLKERKGYESIDNPKILYGILIVVFVLVAFFIYQHMQCSSIRTKMELYDFFEDEYEECAHTRSYFGYAAATALIIWVLFRRMQKKRDAKRTHMSRTYMFNSIVNKKKQN